jgi:hypothetical protein
MKKKEVLMKIIPYGLMLVTAIAGLFIYRSIRDDEIIVGGILGLAVVFYICRFYYFPYKRNDGFFNFTFPGLFRDVLYLLFMSIVLYLAYDQLKNVFLWLIKAF